MLNHGLSRRSRVALLTIATTASLICASPSASAEPRPSHAPTGESDAAEPARASDAPLLDVCPIDGTATFEDSWGWARSGGRRHQGVDMIADNGAPIVAVRDGDARFKNSPLGGRAIWLTTDDGDRFYYAHLDSWEGESRTVEAGDVIGYVGSTGNAHGPHLHFETLPGGSHVNPYLHTLLACVPSPTPDLQLSGLS